MMLSNYKVFFRGKLMQFLNEEKVDSVLYDMRVITAETAFVVRTFFFIIFGWSVFLGSLISFKVILTGFLILTIIYLVRLVFLFIFNGKDIVLELFLAPRGLVTILLFFAIPEELSLGKEFEGVLLFVVLVSCVIMAWSLISYKKSVKQKEESMAIDPIEELESNLENPSKESDEAVESNL
jgi:glucose-6-phosphate-specific signal transduction histidine kinase